MLSQINTTHPHRNLDKSYIILIMVLIVGATLIYLGRIQMLSMEDRLMRDTMINTLKNQKSKNKGHP